MKKENSIILFNQKKVRRHWDEEKEQWVFLIVDVIAILTESVNPQAYWRKLKERLKKEGNESVTDCHALKMQAADGKMRLTDEWQQRGVKDGLEYAILTDEITKAWAGKNIKEYKKFKRLKKQNLRDNMTNLEFVLNMLAEASTTEISKKRKPKSFPRNKEVARQGGHVAGTARKEIESQTGESIVSPENAANLRLENKRNDLGEA